MAIEESRQSDKQDRAFELLSSDSSPIVGEDVLLLREEGLTFNGQLEQLFRLSW